MQFAQRTLLLAALFLASASWFHGRWPSEAGTELIGSEPEPTWVGLLDVNGIRLRFVLAIQSLSGGTKLPPDSGVN